MACASGVATARAAGSALTVSRRPMLAVWPTEKTQVRCR